LDDLASVVGPPIRLAQNLTMVALDEARIDALYVRSRHSSEATVPEPIDGFVYLDPPLRAWLVTHVGDTSSAAYVEAEFFGGVGFQAAFSWCCNAELVAPTTAANDRGASGPQMADWPINVVLKSLGVSAHGAVDEFAAIGLHRHRYVEDWIGG
jgi:hypothetical protein